MLGKNTVSSQQLLSFVDRLEKLRADKKTIVDDETFLMAEAKSAGFVPAGIRMVVKLRAMKPHDRQEAEAIRDQYLHALGMDAETPLFRAVGLMNVDVSMKDSVIEAMRSFVPENGSITIEAGGLPVRLSRDKAGLVSVEELQPAPARPATSKPGAAPEFKGPPPAPDVDDDGAVSLGRAAFRENQPVIANPFPFGDGRRPRWDEGWRRESGTDGMGPDD